MNRTTPGSILAGLFHRKAPVQFLPEAFSQRRLQAKGSWLAHDTNSQTTSLGSQGSVLSLLLMAAQALGAWLFLVIEFHRPPKCSVNFFFNDTEISYCKSMTVLSRSRKFYSDKLILPLAGSQRNCLSKNYFHEKGFAIASPLNS